MSEEERINDNLNQDITSTGPDGIEMEWIEEKKGFFPKITDEFIYLRNLNYGFVSNENDKSDKEEEKIEEKPKELPEWQKRLNNDFKDMVAKLIEDGKVGTETEYNTLWTKFYTENKAKYEKEEKQMIKESKKRLAKPTEAGWFDMDEDKNKSVYVENLPLDITIEDFTLEMSKFGMIMKDFYTHQPRVRLYKQPDDPTKNKGDGLVSYLKIESVEMAIRFLDDTKIKDNVVKVSRAKFERKEGFDPTKRRKMTNKEKKKMKEHHDKLYRWTIETKLTRPKKDNTVILKNAFDVEMMKDNPDKAIDIKEKLSTTLKNVGACRSIKVHDLHPEGIVQIEFMDPNLSDVAVTYFNNKIWNGRKIDASLWDGKTRYKVKETEEQEKERLEKWEKKLEGESEVAAKKAIVEDEGSETGDEEADSD